MLSFVISAKNIDRIVEGTMSQDQYKRVLKTKLLSQFEEYFTGDKKWKRKWWPQNDIDWNSH